MTVSELIDLTARNYANDPSKNSFTESLAVSLLNEAQEELAQELARRSVTSLQHGDARADLEVGSEYVAAPVEMVRPIRLLARERNGQRDWSAVPRRGNFIPDTDPGFSVDWWVWRNGQIRCNPVTRPHELWLQYYRAFNRMSADSLDDDIEMERAANYLARKAGELYFAQIKKDPQQAGYCRQVAAEAFNALAANLARDQQGRPLRRPAIRFGRRRERYPFRPSGSSLLR